MAAADSETVEARALDIFRWRLDELLKAGYPCDDARTLSANLEVDLHLATDLPRRGCPHATALRILL